MSDQDVKDASAGVLRDLKRFQSEKEDDFRRYMVRSFLDHVLNEANYVIRSHTPSAISTGQRRTSKRGKRPKKKLKR